MVPEVLADFEVLNGKDVPYLVSMTQPLLGKEKLKNQTDLTSSEVSTT